MLTTHVTSIPEPRKAGHLDDLGWLSQTFEERAVLNENIVKSIQCALPRPAALRPVRQLFDWHTAG